MSQNYSLLPEQAYHIDPYDTRPTNLLHGKTLDIMESQLLYRVWKHCFVGYLRSAYFHVGRNESSHVRIR
jgi:hypothetical protein